tara:strand:+ start:729 stop:986 length:258 start_codon:yes stop_codon:yes gene_type:complete
MSSMLWWNVDARGQRVPGPGIDTGKNAVGEDVVALVEGAVQQINECYVRGLGRQARNHEIRVAVDGVLDRQTPAWFPRNPESEIL